MSKQLDDLNSQIRVLQGRIQEIRLTDTLKKLAAIKPKNKTRRLFQLEEKLALHLTLRQARREAFDDLLDLIEILTD